MNPSTIASSVLALITPFAAAGMTIDRFDGSVQADLVMNGEFDAGDENAGPITPLAIDNTASISDGTNQASASHSGLADVASGFVSYSARGAASGGNPVQAGGSGDATLTFAITERSFFELVITLDAEPTDDVFASLSGFFGRVDLIAAFLNFNSDPVVISGFLDPGTYTVESAFEVSSANGEVEEAAFNWALTIIPAPASSAILGLGLFAAVRRQRA